MAPMVFGRPRRPLFGDAGEGFINAETIGAHQGRSGFCLLVAFPVIGVQVVDPFFKCLDPF